MFLTRIGHSHYFRVLTPETDRRAIRQVHAEAPGEDVLETPRKQPPG
jgi:hypothetical protein